MRPRFLWLLIVSACGSSDPGGEECAAVRAGDVWAGPAGSTVEIVMTNPSPPARFTNWWAVRITEPDGTPMLDLQRLTVSAFMPEHGHGSPTDPTVTSEPDALIVGPLELWMPGRWEIRFDLPGERLVVPLCIDE